MDERIRSGDTIQLNVDKWMHHGQDYFVHIVKYRENSTGVSLTLEDNNGNIFTTVVSFNQIVKV